MRFLEGVAGVLVVLAAQGCTTVGTPTDTQVMGRVEGVFVEARPGVLVEKSLTTSGIQGDTWVNVALRAPTRDGRTSMSARVGDGLITHRGDLVAVRVSEGVPTLARGPSATAVIASVIESPDERLANRPVRSPVRRVSWTDTLD
ncbi:MAG: hypothetical protein GC151_16280 [Betaproteobacteria bacterium]|nr:hypothetical protein [Betaproteobacteria bacterium]